MATEMTARAAITVIVNEAAGTAMGNGRNALEEAYEGANAAPLYAATAALRLIVPAST